MTIYLSNTDYTLSKCLLSEIRRKRHVSGRTVELYIRNQAGHRVRDSRDCVKTLSTFATLCDSRCNHIYFPYGSDETLRTDDRKS